MLIARTVVTALSLALTPTLAFAQNGGNLDGGTEWHSTARFAKTVRSGRTKPPSPTAESNTLVSMKKGEVRGELGGLTTNSICIGCGAK